MSEDVKPFSQWAPRSQARKVALYQKKHPRLAEAEILAYFLTDKPERAVLKACQAREIGAPHLTILHDLKRSQ